MLLAPNEFMSFSAANFFSLGWQGIYYAHSTHFSVGIVAKWHVTFVKST